MCTCLFVSAYREGKVHVRERYIGQLYCSGTSLLVRYIVRKCHKSGAPPPPPVLFTIIWGLQVYASPCNRQKTNPVQSDTAVIFSSMCSPLTKRQGTVQIKYDYRIRLYRVCCLLPWRHTGLHRSFMNKTIAHF